MLFLQLFDINASFPHFPENQWQILVTYDQMVHDLPVPMLHVHQFHVPLRVIHPQHHLKYEHYC